MNNEVRIKAALEKYYNSLETFDDEMMRQVVHPEAKMFNAGESGTFFIKTREEFIKSVIEAPRRYGMKPFIIKIQEFIHIAVHELIASAEVEWEMVMPNSVGIHHTYYHLAKIDDKWVIVNILDRGKETGGKFR